MGGEHGQECAAGKVYKNCILKKSTVFFQQFFVVVGVRGKDWRKISCASSSSFFVSAFIHCL